VNQVDRLRERFLVQQFRRGNAEAFMKIVQSFERRLLYFLRRFEHDPERAIDALQEVWLTAWKKRTSLRSPDAFRTWIYRIAHGKVIEFIRAERRRCQREGTRQLDVPAPIRDISSSLESAELVHFALSRISPDHREVLTLRFIEGMTIQEIAQVIDCPIGTVKSRLYYASQDIRSVIEGQEHVDK